MGLEMQAVPLPIWQELLVGIEMVYLHVSPVYWGWGVPKGDGSAVIVIPGFLGMDFYLGEFRGWLRRIGYRPYTSGIGINAECPNLLVRHQLCRLIEKAHRKTRKKVHVIGHSLGGTIARSVAAQMPDHVASVIAMAAPIRGLQVHPVLLRLAEIVRGRIQERHRGSVMPDCYTAACTCAFLNSCAAEVPKSVRQTAIYTKADGIVDWRVCTSGKPDCDFEVSATHLGLVFSPIVYQLIAQRLAGTEVSGYGIRNSCAAPEVAGGVERVPVRLHVQRGTGGRRPECPGR